MSLPSHTRRAMAVVTAFSAMTAALTGAATANGAPAVAGSTSQAAVTLVLRAPHPTRLRRLALRHGLSRHERLAALHRLVPSAATERTVNAALRSDGLTVTHETAWTVGAQGPRQLVGQLFGTRPALPSHFTVADLAAATGALPKLPAKLDSAVSAAFPTVGGPRVWHPAAATALSGPDFRNAYDSPAVPTPYDGKDASGPLTIATVQFSNWKPNDLTTYATDNGFADPVASKQYQSRLVDTGPSDSNGDVEVDLDQEALLSTAPHADQTAYFAPNTDAGADDAFAAIFDDVTGDSKAQLPNPHIAAVSSSWGECESAQGAASINAEEPILESLVAAGVTVFSASGDDGIYDCGPSSLPVLGSAVGGLVPSSTPDVDFPASSPVVVGVGGTNLQSTGSSAPNTGSNWTETAWSCTDTNSCESAVGTGGSGGGESGEAASGSNGFGGFAAPSYQSNSTTGVTDSPFAGATKRLVPDIAADGDPATGFNVYTSDSTAMVECGSNTCQVGGTSLATPVSTALFVNTLAHFGLTGGVGDIHSALYSSASDSNAVRDITSGSNGASSDKGADPSVSAQTSYDTVSGVGAILWPALASKLISTPPVVTTALTLATPGSRSHSTDLAATWSVTAAPNGVAPAAQTTVQVTKVGDPTPVKTLTGLPISGRLAIPDATPGGTYVLTVTGLDSLGHPTTRQTGLLVPIDDRSFSYSGRWRHPSNSSDFADSLSVASARNALASLAVTGRNLSLDIATGPTAGKFRVYVDGTAVATVDGYAAHVGHKRVTFFRSATDARHRVQIKVLGQHDRHASGSLVGLDDLAALS